MKISARVKNSEGQHDITRKPIMKTAYYLSLSFFLLISCAPLTTQATSTAAIAETEFVTPPLPTATPWPMPNNVTFCLDKVKSTEEKTTIQEAIRKANQYFVENLEVEPGPVLVYAGPGFDNLAGTGPCADNPNLQRVQRDFLNDVIWEKTGGYAVYGLQVTNTSYFVWKENHQFRYFTVAHEYVHQLQMTLLGRGINGYDAGPGWLIEGSAEVFAMASQGTPPLDEKALLSEVHYKLPLTSQLGNEGDAFWDIAPWAVNYLILTTPDGEKAIVNYFAAQPTSNTWKSAFEKAFGRTPEQFNDEFENFRNTMP